MALIKSVRGYTPQIGSDVFLAENATIIGNVTIGEGSSIWYGAVLRGDVEPIRLGKQVNIQDGSVLHGTYGKAALEIADRVTVGHLVMLHGCKIGYGCLIGMNSTVMDGVEIGEKSLVGAGTLVTEGQKFPPKSLIVGRPAKVKRELTEDELKALEYSADNYLLYKTWYE